MNRPVLPKLQSQPRKGYNRPHASRSTIPNPKSAIRNPKYVLVETPRDAFQGIRDFIPTQEKIAHIEKLIDAGLRCIDFGSFVSPRAVPQMKDSEEVLEEISHHPDLTLIAIVVNERGLQRAAATGKVHSVGFPFSVSNTFQVRNTNRSILQTWPVVGNLISGCASHGMDFILYLSMAFGNPYGDPWSPHLLIDFVRRLQDVGVRTLYLADTTSEATVPQIHELVERCRSEFLELDLGVHLHSDAGGWRSKLEAALECGIGRIDSAVAGMGGCPFAHTDLVGNVPTEGVVELLESHGIHTGVNRAKLQSCVHSARRLMELYGTVLC